MHCQSGKVAEFTDFRLIRPEVLADRGILPMHEVDSVHEEIRDRDHPVRIEEWHKARDQLSLQRSGLQV